MPKRNCIHDDTVHKPQEHVTAAQPEDNFEAGLARLAKIVDMLGEEQLPLEEGMRLFKEGVLLAQSCRTRLEEAHNEVTLLTEQGLKEFSLCTDTDDPA